MTLKEEFRLAAQEVVATFSEDIGQSTFYSLVSSGYDAVGGDVTNTFLDPVLVNIAYDSVAAELLKMSKTDVSESPYNESSRIAYIAGADLSVEPKENDRIVAADDGLTYYIKDIETDEYKAVYKCYLYLIPGI